jgi:hypothetical protein
MDHLLTLRAAHRQRLTRHRVAQHVDQIQLGARVVQDPQLWGALIFLALFVSCLLAWKAIEWLRNRRKFDGVAMEEGQTKDPGEPLEPWDQAISRPSADEYNGDEWGGLGGMNQREQEEIFSTYAPRKVRKAAKPAESNTTLTACSRSADHG